LSPQELQDIVDRLGEDPAEWPASVAREARQLIEKSDEAQDILDQAARLRLQLMDAGHEAPAFFADQVVALALALDPANPDAEDLS